jgi:hypothetical protein
MFWKANFNEAGMRNRWIPSGQCFSMTVVDPPVRTNFGINLTEEEANYLVDRLFGVNSEIGLGILSKLQESLSSK